MGRITMELHYARQIKEITKIDCDPEKILSTWTWYGDDMRYDKGWTKDPAPGVYATGQEAEEWYDRSNQEDLIMLDHEQEYFIKYKERERAEIYAALNNSN